MRYHIIYLSGSFWHCTPLQHFEQVMMLDARVNVCLCAGAEKKAKLVTWLRRKASKKSEDMEALLNRLDSDHFEIFQTADAGRWIRVGQTHTLLIILPMHPMVLNIPIMFQTTSISTSLSPSFLLYVFSKGQGSIPTDRTDIQHNK